MRIVAGLFVQMSVAAKTSFVFPLENEPLARLVDAPMKEPPSTQIASVYKAPSVCVPSLPTPMAFVQHPSRFAANAPKAAPVRSLTPLAAFVCVPVAEAVHQDNSATMTRSPSIAPPSLLPEPFPLAPSAMPPIVAPMALNAPRTDKIPHEATARAVVPQTRIVPPIHPVPNAAQPAQASASASSLAKAMQIAHKAWSVLQILKTASLPKR